MKVIPQDLYLDKDSDSEKNHDEEINWRTVSVACFRCLTLSLSLHVIFKFLRKNNSDLVVKFCNYMQGS